MCLCSMHALQRAARGALPCDWERAPWLGSRRAAVTKVYIYKLQETSFCAPTCEMTRAQALSS